MKKLLMVLSLMFITESYADTETINWYVDGDTYTTTTCQTGGDITLQTPPAKRGYTFTGWQVALYDFSTLDADVKASSYTRDESTKTWTTTFSYGVVSGQALCSQTIGTYAKTGTPDESGDGETQYCWCKATGYKPAGDDKVYENTSFSAWVFRYNGSSASGCALDCARNCGAGVQALADLRRALFGITQ